MLTDDSLVVLKSLFASLIPALNEAVFVYRKNGVGGVFYGLPVLFLSFLKFGFNPPAFGYIAKDKHRAGNVILAVFHRGQVVINGGL